ncbi:MAG: YggS family pyridoxal phosphate-dependent enzyme [Treponema sp.]|jgi:pyridoxal phosphate enzyme (YggS family)|nr:YggS family pyridoxal phosphate-dependent enzyme [Treponema sp.]
MAFAEALERLEERIHGACARSGRAREELTLLGVSKFHSREEVEEAWGKGIRFFGESRVREGAEKFSGFRESRPGTEIHMIGSLQSNKARAAVSLFDCVQSLDRDSIIRELGKYAVSREKPLRVLLELHTGEESKKGFSGEESLFRAAETVLSFPGLRIAGLMTMAPFTGLEEGLRSSFRAVVKARSKLESRFPGSDWSCLSMGMSNDFETAIEEGSTLIRIGTLLFGERPG